MSTRKIQRALISVSDKLGLEGFAVGLAEAGVEIFSTGGTRKHLEAVGVRVNDVAEYTGFPEVMGGRVKTLHPRVFGGVLARRDVSSDLESAARHDIAMFDLVVVNLYPFESTIARESVTRAEAIEQIDVGGPSLIRAAAKNHKFVSVVTSPGQYSGVLRSIQASGDTTPEQRRKLAADAFAVTAAYDRVISRYFADEERDDGFPARINVSLDHKVDLRYGENPHQNAALYRWSGVRGANLVNARQLCGKELSYNNYLDLDAALAMVRDYADPGCAVIKHKNPCGAAVDETLAGAAEKALEGDPISAFGGIVGFNRTLDVETAELLSAPGRFIEAIVAPDFEAAAVGVLTTKPKWRQSVRLVQVGKLDDDAPQHAFRFIHGGVLVQDPDSVTRRLPAWKVVTDAEPFEHVWPDVEFAWRTVAHVRSNAIVLCGDRSLYGAGAGQMSRVDSVRLAIQKAGQRAEGSVLASDAFFPFPDSIEMAAAAGIRVIVQPGGSKKDAEVIDACNRLGVPMVFTGRRHFKH